MALTYEPIATTTLGSATNSVTFSSISASYTDLVLIISGKNTANSTNYYRFNSDSANNYSQTNLIGDGTSATSSRRSNNDAIIFADNVGTGTNIFSYILNLCNYSNTTTYKTTLHRDGTGAASTTANVGLWRSTSAITSISITGTNNFASGTTFTLYGILSA